MEYSLGKIAEIFGISKTTVSLILNGKAQENRISPELTAKVTAFCDEVNYIPNIHAKRIRKKIVGNIGLLINEDMLSDGPNPFSDQIMSEITGGVVLAAERHGFRVTIQLYNSSMKEQKIFDWLRDKEIDGLIYYGCFLDSEWIEAFLSEKRCIVGIGIAPFDGVTTVNIENRSIMREITGHMLDKGRTKFIYLAGADSYVSEQRFLGMTDCLSERNIAFDERNVINGEFSEGKAYEIFRSIKIDFDAVVCANDYMAIGAVRALKERGVKIPQDISICGADNICGIRYTEPKISTINNMSSELGKTATEELLRLIDGKKPRCIILKSAVILNGSI